MKNVLTRSITIVFVFVAIYCITGCSKDNTTNNNNTPTSYKVKTIINAYSSGGSTSIDTSTFTYDSQGRLLADVSTFIGSSYTINGNTISITTVFPAPLTGSLNAAGSIAQLTKPSIGSDPLSTYYYTYDATGAMIYDTCIWDNGTTTGAYYATSCVWSDSNMVSCINTDYSQATPIVTTYAFVYLSTREYRDYGFSEARSFSDFISGTVGGRNSRNLVNTETQVKSGTSITYTHTYSFDSKGRVTTESVAGTDGSSNVASYGYY